MRKSKDFKDARDILDGIEDAEKVQQRNLEKKADWDDPLDVALHHEVDRIEIKHRDLKRLVPKRICPHCSRLKPDTSSWIINKKRTFAMCRSCFASNFPDEDVEEMRIPHTIFPEEEIRYVVDSFALAAAREAKGIKRKSFATACGWSASYQAKLEKGKILTVAAWKAHAILKTLRGYKVLTKDTI
jgi:hypothetical protein